MKDEQAQGGQMALFGVIFTIIALVALLAIVFVRSRAQSTPTLNQMQTTAMVPMTMGAQTLQQLQGQTVTDVLGIVGPGTPAPTTNPVILVPGGNANNVVLTVPVNDPNGVVNTLIQANARVNIVAMYGSDVTPDPTYWSCQYGPDLAQTYDGTQCWAGSYDGTGKDLNATSGGTCIPALGCHLGGGSITMPIITAASQDINETNAQFQVGFALPYYAKPGVWTISWRIVPVDDTGTLDPAHTLTNTASTDLVKATVGRMVALDVDTPNVAYTLLNGGGSNMVPNSDSDPVVTTVSQLGNVIDYMRLSGTDWTCSSGQTMPVDSTRFAANLTGFGYASTDAQAMSTNPSGDRVQDFTSGVLPAVYSQLPLSSGGQSALLLSPTSVRGQSQFDHAVHVPTGISGTCSASFTVIGEDAGL